MPVMDLFPSDLRKALPPLTSQGGIGDPIVHVKFFAGEWTWFVTEGSPDGDDFIFFGYVIVEEGEWGYFSLSELTEASEALNRPIERDLNFRPTPFSQIGARVTPSSRNQGERSLWEGI